MSHLEKYFLGQLNSHHCELPPSDDMEYIQKISRFKNIFLISEKSLEGYLKIKSLSAVYYEKRRQVRTALGFVIHPYSRLRSFCRVADFFLILAALLYYPFFCSFIGPYYVKRSLKHKCGTYCFTVFYSHLSVLTVLQMLCLVQVAVSFMTGYSVEGKEEIVIHLPGIAKHYFCTYFLPDIISSLPLDALIVATRGIDEYANLSKFETFLIGAVPLLKFSNMRTLNLCFRAIFMKFHESRVVCSMAAVIGLYILIMHWGACLPMFFTRIFFSYNLFHPFEDIRLHENLPHMYITCVYVAVTALVNTGFDIDEFDNITIKVVFVFLVIVGKVYRMVTLIFLLHLLCIRNSGKLRYLEMMDQVEQYMKVKHFPRELQRKIKINYIYLFRKENVGERSILRLLSDNLRREILLSIHHRLIERATLFSGFSEDLIFQFVSCLKPEIYLPNDVVYQVGEVGECMYFVSFGTVAVYSENKEEIGHLHGGDHFGEISLIFQMRRTATIVALETTELYSLDAQDFGLVIKTHPSIFQKMEALAKSRLLLSQDMETTPTVFEFRNFRTDTTNKKYEGHYEKDTKSDSD